MEFLWFAKSKYILQTFRQTALIAANLWLKITLLLHWKQKQTRKKKHNKIFIKINKNKTKINSLATAKWIWSQLQQQQQTTTKKLIPCEINEWMLFETNSPNGPNNNMVEYYKFIIVYQWIISLMHESYKEVTNTESKRDRIWCDRLSHAEYN